MSCAMNLVNSRISFRCSGAGWVAARWRESWVSSRKGGVDGVLDGGTSLFSYSTSPAPWQLEIEWVAGLSS